MEVSATTDKTELLPHIETIFDVASERSVPKRGLLR